MSNDKFEAYFRSHVAPVPKSDSFDARTKETLNTLPKKKNTVIRWTAVFVIEVAVVMVFLAVVMPGSQAILSTPWLSAYSSEDGQQYIVEGKILDPELVIEADADGDNWLETENYTEFVESLGFDPHFPQNLDGGWVSHSYYAVWMTEGLSVSTQYKRNDGVDGRLRLCMQVLNDPEEQRIQFQYSVEDGYGSIRDIDGISVYAEYDAEWHQYALRWIIDSCLFEVQGNVSFEKAKECMALLTKTYMNLTEEEKGYLLPTGEVAGHPEELATLDMEVAKEFVAGAFNVPCSVPDGFDLEEIRCIRSDYSLHAIYDYTDSQEQSRRAKISINRFSETEGVVMNYEQNGPGKNVRYRGKDIYVTHNMERIVCIYLNDQNFYLVTGMIDWNEAKAFLDTLID